ncbi:MAG TPA: hypothetical protein VJ906_11185, partial [Roseovarius sp.]|nr:hypothetical protein [Roseovarius sp.]
MDAYIGQRLSRRAVLRFGAILAGLSGSSCAPSFQGGAKALSDEEWGNVAGSDAHLKRLILQFQNQGGLARDGSRFARLVESNMALGDPQGPRLSADRRSREEIIADRRAYARFQEREHVRAPIQEIDEDLIFAFESAAEGLEKPRHFAHRLIQSACVYGGGSDGQIARTV